MCYPVMIRAHLAQNHRPPLAWQVTCDDRQMWHRRPL